MATNIVVPKNKSRVFNLILRYFGKSTTLSPERGLKNLGHARRRIWHSPGTPETLQAQYATSPYNLLQIGDICLDTSNKLVYVCTVDCAVSTDATWTLVSVD